MSRRDFAESLNIGIREHVINDIERGAQRASIEFISAIVKQHKVNYEWLIDGDDCSNLNERFDVKNGASITDDTKLGTSSKDWNLSSNLSTQAWNTPPKEPIQSLPLYDIQAAAGAGVFSDQEAIKDRIPFKTQELQKADASLDHSVVIEVSGKSMEPVIVDKAKVVVDLSDIDLVASGIYVFRRDGALFVKRLELAGRTIFVESINKDYRSYELNTQEEPDFQILGKVKMVLQAI